MKKVFSTIASLAAFACICSDVQAAELLDVKPVESGTAVAIEITADIPMTYTFYKIPGQARAVVDIADADPEKIEPLIVINKGLVSSISVDKAQIAGMVVSRVIFNLISEADISVSASPDRKLLTATFGGAAAKPVSAPVEAKPLQASAPETPVPATAKSEVKLPEIAKEPAVKPAPAATETKTDDSAGLEEPPAVASTTAPAAKETTAVVDIPAPAPPAASSKLEPAVPVVTKAAAVYINKIITGDNYIDIQTSAEVGNYKVIVLKQPERIAIDITGAKSSLGTRSVAINKLGITKARIGINPGYVRIVLDAEKSTFPKYTVTNKQNALRITFN